MTVITLYPRGSRQSETPTAAPQPQPQPQPISSRRRLSAWMRVGLVLVCIAVFHGLNLAGWPAFFDDEGTYYSQAYAVQHLQALAPYNYWYDHPPVGWLQLAPLTWVTDLFVSDAQPALLAGRIVSVLYTLATCVLLYALARRLRIGRWLSLAAMAAYGLNPLVIFEGRQLYLDNLAMPWVLGALLLATNHQRSLFRHMSAGLLFGIAVLTKETTLILLPVVLLALWQSAYRPTRAFSVLGFLTSLTMVGGFYVLFATIRQELLPGADHVSLVDALRFQFTDRAGSGSLLDPESSAFGIVQSWTVHDPYLLLVGAVAAVGCLAVRRLRPVGLAVVLMVLVALRPDGYLPAMYVIALLPFCALAIFGLLDMLWQAARRISGSRLRVAASGGVLAVVATTLLPVPAWADAWESSFTIEMNDEHAAALDDVRRNVPRDSVIVVDNTYWNDLVQAGWNPDSALWFYKVDKDDAVTRQIGGSYQGLDYLLWSPAMRDYVQQDSDSVIMRSALANSDVVSAHGEGVARVEIRKIRQSTVQGGGTQ